MKLLLIGCGNMGSAIVNALSGQEIFDDVEVYDRSSSKCDGLDDVTVAGSIEEAFIDEETVVLIAVKPQDLEAVFTELNGRFVEGSLLMSIAAGVSLERLKVGTGWEAIVRVMPNTPIMVSEGASAWTASPGVTDSHRVLIRSMLESFGIEMEVPTEEDIDKVTALSGSGPAYVFYFLEALVEGATALGLSEEQALLLATQTVIGGAEMSHWVHSLDDLKQLRANVTSKGGTTEQAIRVFDERSFKEVVSEAMRACYQHTKKL